jgi:leucyl aminopeptidase
VAASNAIMADFEFVKYKTPPAEGFTFIKEIEAVVAKLPQSDIAEGIRRGIIIGEETNACRALSNMPGGDMTPQLLARHAVREADRVGIKATVLDEKKMKTLGMGGILGVGQGSNEPPRFIILEYMKGAKAEKPIVLVGKGVTFDTGGLNLKPGNHIYEMHMDMSGGAAVIHTLIAAARLKLKKNIVALVPAAENMPSGSSYRPGDVLRTMNGKTIEVLNTDAEGRVILADALEYAKRYHPALVVDVATLTGASMVALGSRYSGIFTMDKKLEDKFRTTGEAVNDPVWPLPLGLEDEEDVKGVFADWSNAGKPGAAGATTGAAFLWQFIKGYPWVHLDIAPRMTAMENEYLAKGAVGTPVRLLARLLED